MSQNAKRSRGMSDNNEDDGPEERPSLMQLFLYLEQEKNEISAREVFLVAGRAAFAAEKVALATEKATFAAEKVAFATEKATFAAEKVALATEKATFAAEADDQVLVKKVNRELIAREKAVRGREEVASMAFVEKCKQEGKKIGLVCQSSGSTTVIPLHHGVLIGRNPAKDTKCGTVCGICVVEDRVSRIHCMITYNDTSLGVSVISPNGLYIDNEMDPSEVVSKHCVRALAEGSVIKLIGGSIGCPDHLIFRVTAVAANNVGAIEASR